jgi:hypothetical protein
MVRVMPRRGGRAHVATIRTKDKGGTVYTSYLLRRSYREGGKARHENLGNLSHLPPGIIEAIRGMLAGRVLVDLEERFGIERSLPHGHGRARRPPDPHHLEGRVQAHFFLFLLAYYLLFELQVRLAG